MIWVLIVWAILGACGSAVKVVRVWGDDFPQFVGNAIGVMLSMLTAVALGRLL